MKPRVIGADRKDEISAAARALILAAHRAVPTDFATRPPLVRIMAAVSMAVQALSQEAMKLKHSDDFGIAKGIGSAVGILMRNRHGAVQPFILEALNEGISEGQANHAAVFAPAKPSDTLN